MNEFKDYFMRPRQSVDFDPENDEPHETALDEEIEESQPAITKKKVALVLILVAFFSFALGREFAEISEKSNSHPLPTALAGGVK